VIAERGLNFDGGDVMVWRRNRIICEHHAYTVAVGPRENAHVFGLLQDHALFAVCIKADGGVSVGPTLRSPRGAT